jgi:hypothetical protein
MPNIATATIETDPKLAASRRAITRFGGTGGLVSRWVGISLDCMYRCSIGAPL